MRPSHFCHKYRAFSLLELLAVIALLGVLAVFVVPSVRGIAAGTELTISATSVVDTLNLARQTALSGNRPVEVRIFKVPEEAGGDGSGTIYRAVGVYQINDDGPRQIGKLTLLRKKVAGAEDQTFGPLLQYLPSATSPLREFDPSLSTTYTYRYFQYRPDGSTNLAASPPSGDDSWHMMFYNLNSPPSGATPPPNYISLQLDPVTGRTRLFQPGQ